MRRSSIRTPLLLIVIVVLLGGCNSTSSPSATPTSAPQLSRVTHTFIVTPTTIAQTPQSQTISQSTATSVDKDNATTTTSDDHQNIKALVSYMQDAVLKKDKDSYLSHVDLTDPTFALEHTRWADGWIKQPPASFTLEVRDIIISNSSATGVLTLNWKMADASDEISATLPALFSRGVDGRWRFAGESWVSLNTEHFRLKALPGLEGETSALTPDLPEVYTHVTSILEYTPSRNPEIKLYDSSQALVAMTLLNLPENIRGWNEPGEALKFRVAPRESALTAGIAHEFTHYATFDMAGTASTRMPWWLEEGLAVYVSTYFELPQRTQDRFDQVRKWAANDELAGWNSISDFEATPVDMWTYVYPQGYAMVRYVTERFGKEQRNRWVAAMAKDMEIKQATTEILGLSFEDLDHAFVIWMKQQ